MENELLYGPSLVEEIKKEYHEITSKIDDLWSNSLLYKARNKMLERSVDFLSSLGSDDKVLSYTHNDGDGLTSAILQTLYFKARDIPCEHLIMDVWHRNNYQEIIVDKLRETGARILAVSDISLPVKLCEYLSSQDIKVIIIDHHDDELKKHLEHFQNKDYVYANFKFGLREGPSAAPSVFKVFKAADYKNLVNYDENIWLAFMGAAADKQLIPSIHFLEPQQYQINAFARGFQIDPFFNTTLYAIAMAYAEPRLSKPIFNFLKEAVIEKDPLYFWRTSDSATKEIYEILENVEEETKFWLKEGEVTRDDRVKFYMLKIKPSEKKREPKWDLKRMLVGYLGIRYPLHSVVAAIDKGDKVTYSIRKHVGDLTHLVDVARKEIPPEELTIGGHYGEWLTGGAVGAIVSKKFEEKFDEILLKSC